MPHFTRDGGEEVSPVLPVRIVRAEQPQVHLVDQARGPQGVTGPFLPEIAGRDATQLRVHERHQLIPRLFVSAAQFSEQRRDMARGRLGHVRCS